VSSDQLYACAVYILVIFGIVQLIVTILGLVGNFTDIIKSSNVNCDYYFELSMADLSLLDVAS